MGKKKVLFGRPAGPVVPDEDKFITSWNITSGDEIVLPLAGTCDCLIEWGDGSKSTYKGDVADRTHTYTDTQVFDIKISGIAQEFRVDNDALIDTKVLELKNWGVGAYTYMSFYGCTNMIITATDIPDLINTTSFSNRFYSCSSVTTIPNIGLWDVSRVTTFKQCFRSCNNWEGMDLSNWDVSSVTGDGMYMMFYSAQKLESDLSGWVVSGITSMHRTFGYCYLFNSDLLGFDTSSVISMYQTFYRAKVFNGDISNWDVSKVTVFSGTFRDADIFNSDISGWTINTSASVSMTSMFSGAHVFNSDISGWDVSRVYAMRLLLFQNNVFDHDLSGWDISRINSINYSSVNSIYFEKMLTAWNNLTFTALTTDLNSFAGCTYDPVATAAGTVTSKAAFKLIDSTASFIGVVNVNDVIRNITPDGQERYEWMYAKVVSVDSDTELTISQDIMQVVEGGSEDLVYNVETSDFSYVRENLVNVHGFRVNDGNITG